MDSFFEGIYIAISILLTIILIVVGIVGLVAVFSSIGYFNNAALEEVILDGNIIYSGPSRSVGWSQMGEYGNNYYVKTYKPGFWNMFFCKIENVRVGSSLVVNSI